MTTKLVVEGWRRSSHSYALVNQHQLLQLSRDPRLNVAHVDIPLPKTQWEQLDAGFDAAARQQIDSITTPASGPDQPSADVIYRISWPMRVHAGDASRVFVFGTSELQRLQPRECCGPSGSYADVDREAVEIITPSAWSRVGFVASGFDERRVHVIPHGVNARLFRRHSPEEKRRIRLTMQIPDHCPVFLHIGAMTRYKGIGPLLAAFALYQQRDERAVLLLKGSDALYGNLMTAALADAARLLGRSFPQSSLHSIRYSGDNLSLAGVAQLYGVADVYLAPYRAEGFDLPVLEALASGVVPIVTAGGATDDFCPDRLSLKVDAVLTSLEDGGRFLEPRLDSIVECMRSAVQDEMLRGRVAAEGPPWVGEHYTWSRVGRLLADRLAA